MQNLLETLKQLLSKDERFMSEGKLLKNQIMEHAIKLDESLIKLLMSDASIKKHFFKEIAGALVFDKEKFLRFVSNKQFLPDSYTAFKNKIGLSDDGINYLTQRGDITLVWPYKDCVLEGGQTKEEAKRDEIFYNEILAPDEINRLLDPKVLSNFKKYDKSGENDVSSISEDDNYFIRGNNLLALNSLAEKFEERVKLIFIDPPYNTENDSFQYNDSFTHSTWLTFMRNRLEVAKKLLSKDGSIYIQLDSNEVHYFKILMDEIFGRDNFRREIIWSLGTSSGYKSKVKNWVRGHDTILFYSKSESFTFNPLFCDYDERYKARFKKIDKDGRKYRDDRTNGDKQYLDALEGIRIGDVWDDVMSFQQASTSAEYEGFSTQKPEELLERIILASTNENDIVLDFFAGTGTTGVVALKLKRRWLLVEQMEEQIKILKRRLSKTIKGTKEGITERVKWMGGGSYIWCELKHLNEHLAEQIQSAKSKNETLKIWEAMQKTAFLSYRIDLKNIDEHASSLEELSAEDQKRFLMEVLDKNMLYVNFSDIDDADYKVSAEDKKLNHQFYSS